MLGIEPRPAVVDGVEVLEGVHALSLHQNIVGTVRGQTGLEGLCLNLLESR